MANQKLTLEPRAITGKKVKNLRKQGVIPASICGKGVENANFQLDRKTFSDMYRRIGRTTLIDLQTPNGMLSAFVRQVQIHPVSRDPIHVDFRVVDLRVAITADVTVTAVGTNTEVERGNAVVSIVSPTLHVKALPADLPNHVEIDISTLEVGATLHVSDLNLGDKVEVLTAPESSLVTLTASRMEADAEQIQEAIASGDMEIARDDADTNAEATTNNAANDNE